MGAEENRVRPFLTAEWRNLVMLNYEVEAGVLRRYVPSGVELDAFEGKTYVSVVGFQFLGTRLGGRVVSQQCDMSRHGCHRCSIAAPLHLTFNSEIAMLPFGRIIIILRMEQLGGRRGIPDV